jgi:hypothetical protein
MSPARSTVLFTNVLVPRGGHHIDSINVQPGETFRELVGGEKATGGLSVQRPFMWLYICCTAFLASCLDRECGV